MTVDDLAPEDVWPEQCCPRCGAPVCEMVDGIPRFIDRCACGFRP